MIDTSLPSNYDPNTNDFEVEVVFCVASDNDSLAHEPINMPFSKFADHFSSAKMLDIEIYGETVYLTYKRGDDTYVICERLHGNNLEYLHALRALAPLDDIYRHALRASTIARTEQKRAKDNRVVNIYLIKDPVNGHVGYVGLSQDSKFEGRKTSHHSDIDLSHDALHKLLTIDEPITSNKKRWLTFVHHVYGLPIFEVAEVVVNWYKAHEHEMALIQKHLDAGVHLTNKETHHHPRPSTPCPYEPDRLLWRQRLLGC